jgi:hypothetical protein
MLLREMERFGWIRTRIDGRASVSSFPNAFTTWGESPLHWVITWNKSGRCFEFSQESLLESIRLVPQEAEYVRTAFQLCPDNTACWYNFHILPPPCLLGGFAQMCAVENPSSKNLEPVGYSGLSAWALEESGLKPRFGASPCSGPVTGHLRRRGLGQTDGNKGDIEYFLLTYSLTLGPQFFFRSFSVSIHAWS